MTDQHGDINESNYLFLDKIVVDNQKINVLYYCSKKNHYFDELDSVADYTNEEIDYIIDFCEINDARKNCIQHRKNNVYCIYSNNINNAIKVFHLPFQSLLKEGNKVSDLSCILMESATQDNLSLFLKYLENGVALSQCSKGELLVINRCLDL